MKQLSIILLIFFFSLSAKATTYYVAANGNDANNGTSIGTPFKTIAKVNSLALVAGDMVSFNGGDAFAGTINITHAGSAGHNIIYNSYGTGKAIITGFTNVTLWTNLGANIWESSNSVSTLSTCNLVLINGVNTPMGRTPNTGSWYIYQSPTSTTLTSSSLNSAVTNWTGAQACIRTIRFMLEVDPITSQSGSTITYSGGGKGTAGFGFFIQNDARTLDVQNEWYYSPTTKKIRIFSASQPVNVQVPTVNELVLINNKNFITLDNLSFIGANTNIFENITSKHILINNCSFKYALNGEYNDNGFGQSVTTQFCTFSNINNRDFHYKDFAAVDTIVHNTIDSTALIPGAWFETDQNSGDAIRICGPGSYVGLNTITNTGHSAIIVSQTDGLTAQYNFISGFGLTKYDAGGIYSFNQDTTIATTRVIDHNIILNSNQVNDGSIGGNGLSLWGIYLDGNSKNTTITNNSVYNCFTGAALVYDAGGITFRNNTGFNNGSGLNLSSDNAGQQQINNITSKNNYWIAQTSTQLAMLYQDNLNIFKPGNFDSNYYARPIADNLTITTQINNTPTNRNLAMWQTYSGIDLNSKKSPAAITNVNQLFFAYDSSQTSSVVTIPAGNWIDVTGTPYNSGTVTLQPFTSIVLISTGTNIPPIANAGTNVNITLPTNSFTQVGSGTDADGTIVAYNWTQISGANTATIGSPNSATTLISNLIAGNYIFQLKVTDNGGATATDTMSAVVNSMVVNVPPTVNAGGNKIITLPTNTVTQNGSATPGTGTIVSYQWTQSPSNPIAATIVSPTNPVTVINNLSVSGVYSFTLSCTDNLGSVGQQTITVTVNAPIPVPPTAHAGVDQTIAWPTNSVTLSGTATAGTGTITTYHWALVSGATFAITNQNSATTTVTGLDVGTYLFELTVTDNSGLQGKDTMMVTVNKGAASLSYTVTSVVFNNAPQAIGITTTPAGLATASTYNGIGQIPTNAGSYATISNITDLAHYNSTAISGTFTITKQSVTITVSNTTQTYTGSQLPVTVTTNPNVSGISVTYNGSATVPTNAGSYTVVASLSNINYQATPVTTTLVINKATPTVSWSTPAAITYGTALSGTQLNATASVAGTFTYTPASGAILNAGTNVLSVDFTPTDGTNYNSVTGTAVSLVVNKATATISLSNLNQIFDGNPKPVTVTTSPVGLTVITTTYNGSTTAPSAIGTYPIVSSLNNSNYTATPATGNLVISSSSASIFITNLNQTYSGSQLPVTVTTTPTGLTYSITYNGSATVPTNAGSYTTIATITQIGFSGADTETYVIAKATPIINWANPSAITYGTALSGTQLNASTSVAGTFVYSPISGVVLNAGSYVLSTSFTPTDASNYNTASATVNITVNKATATLSLSNLSQQYDGTPKSVIATSTPSGLSGITVTYNGSLSIPINAGSYPILVVLVNSNYSASNVSGTLVIAKASSILSWATPAAIQQGTALSATQLNATSNNPGTFSYNFPIGYVAQNNLTLTATFTPTDAVNYNVQTISVFQSVYGKAVLDIYIIHGHVIYLNLPQ